MEIILPFVGLGWRFPEIDGQAIILCEPLLYQYKVYLNLGLMSYINQSYIESLIISLLSSLYCALCKPSEMVGLVKTVLTVC